MKEILYNFSRVRAKNAQHVLFLTHVLAAIPQEVAEARGFAARLTAFAAAAANEQECFRPGRAFLDTTDIVAADRARDELFYFYNQVIQAYASYHPDAERRKAGATLAFAFREAGNVAKADYASETASLTDLVGTLRSEPYVAALAVLGLDEAPDELEAVNQAFDALFVKRTAEERDRAQSWNMKMLRLLSDAAFDDLAKAINALYISNELVAGDEAIRTELGKVIDDVNAVIVCLKKTMNQGAAGVDPSEDEPGDTTPTPEPEKPEPDSGDEGGSPL